jgi:small-conductance mechanosensitive channel
MAISWITALKMVPWGDVIEATPQVVKAAKNLLRKKDAAQEIGAQGPAAAEPLAPPRSAAEQALQLIQAQEARITQLEQSQRQSLELIEKLAEQNAQIVATVGALRTGAQRLAWACAILGVCVAGLLIQAWRT